MSRRTGDTLTFEYSGRQRPARRSRRQRSLDDAIDRSRTFGLLLSSHSRNRHATVYERKGEGLEGIEDEIACLDLALKLFLEKIDAAEFRHRASVDSDARRIPNRAVHPPAQAACKRRLSGSGATDRVASLRRRVGSTERGTWLLPYQRKVRDSRSPGGRAFKPWSQQARCSLRRTCASHLGHLSR